MWIRNVMYINSQPKYLYGRIIDKLLTGRLINKLLRWHK